MSSAEEEFVKQLQEAPLVTPVESSAGVRGGQSFSKRTLFEHPDTHPLTLEVVLLSKYGPQWLAWEAETVWAEIKEDFSPAISVHTRNKVQALRTCHAVTSAWDAWEVFVVVCAALNNNVPNFQILQRPSIAQMMNAVHIMKKIADHEFNDEVANFISVCALDDGVYYLPEPLNFAQEWATRTKYKCSKCGKIDFDTDNDMCDLCGAPESALEKFLVRDPTPIARRYAERLTNPNTLLEENEVDIQVAKLTLARNYVEYRDNQLREQLEVLRNG